MRMCAFETVLEGTTCIWLLSCNASLPMEKDMMMTVSIELIRNKTKYVEKKSPEAIEGDKERTRG